MALSMSSDRLTRPKIERRLNDNLRKGNTAVSEEILTELSVTTPDASSLLRDNPENMTFIQRLRYTIVVRYLQRLNLTTYKRLRRAYGVINDLQTSLNKLYAERDELAQLLRNVAADRDRLVNIQQTAAIDREQFKANLEALRAEHARLQETHETLRVTYDQVAHKNTAFETQVSILTNVPTQPTEELVDLPLTVKAESVIPHRSAVDAYLTGRDKTNDELETDSLYYVLETSFRGSEEEIKQRQRQYLAYLTIVDPRLPVVDLGCGRGEFLELMREQRIRALGVDTNAENIAELRRKGLDVQHQDALVYLESVAPESLAAVTAFQVIEHVPHVYLRSLIRLSYEKLTPGGFLFLETVNPYCLETYRTYYLDPTHRNPVPKDLLAILYHFYGFTEQQIFYQNPINPKVAAAQSQELSFLYQSYALMGIKLR
jgi:O-antigen chain-terminating methyltransferase